VITKSLLLFTSDLEGYQTLIQDLNRYSGYHCRVGGQSEEAWNQLTEEKVDLLLLDFAPGVDGVPYIQALHVSHPELPILIITAPHQVELRSRCLSVGVADYLVTPFRCEELAVRIETIFHHRAVHDERHYLQWAGICLDEKNNRIRNGAAQWLTMGPMECKALATLFKFNGCPISKETLGEVLGSKNPLNENAVEVLIHRVRSRVQSLNLKIRSLRGTGYVIERLTN
jgi:DNA-binding response OmpR family regulator